MEYTHRMLPPMQRVQVQLLGNGFHRVGARRKEHVIIYLCAGGELTTRSRDEFNRLFEPIHADAQTHASTSSRKKAGA